jgi:hypothetical protein
VLDGLLDVLRLLPLSFRLYQSSKREIAATFVTRNPRLICESPKEETAVRKRRWRRSHDLWGFEDRKAVGDLAGSKNSGDLFA